MKKTRHRGRHLLGVDGPAAFHLTKMLDILAKGNKPSLVAASYLPAMLMP